MHLLIQLSGTCLLLSLSGGIACVLELIYDMLGIRHNRKVFYVGFMVFFIFGVLCGYLATIFVAVKMISYTG